jgi:lysophospholipase L1-like esterase
VADQHKRKQMKFIQAHKRILKLLLLFFATSSFIVLHTQKPTLYIIGDSTVRNTNRPQCGWGEMIGSFFDTTQISISNQAMAGRSTRTFIKEKRWEKVLSTLQQGDYVIMQFGHNEGSKPDTSRGGYRGVLRGTGEDSVSLTWKDSSIEVVHSYGCSMIPRNQWTDGKVRLANNDFGKWAKEVAESEGVYFIDLNSITAEKYHVLGEAEVAKLFHKDHTHTNEDGAKINAASVVEGMKLLNGLSLINYLLN